MTFERARDFVQGVGKEVCESNVTTLSSLVIEECEQWIPQNHGTIVNMLGSLMSSGEVISN